MFTLIRWVLVPISGIYATVVWLRNRLYDLNLFKSKSFDFPVIVIGNLAVGGTGKSPMVEHILRIVNPLCRITVLSRGYGRSTKGFRYVQTNDSARTVGDEPLQIKRKFQQNTVVVCEDRVSAIENIKADTDAVLLDDAFQHRKLKPSFSILLFEYSSLLKPILPLPTGHFRDRLSESKRAHIIVVTKCPKEIDGTVKRKIITRLKAYSSAPVFFSRIAYQSLVNPLGEKINISSFSSKNIVLLSGIANPTPLYDYLSDKVKSIVPVKFPDHHEFSTKDLAHVETTFKSMEADKAIITTEKDFQRLPDYFIENLPIYYIPIKQDILFNQTNDFDYLIKQAFLNK